MTKAENSQSKPESKENLPNDFLGMLVIGKPDKRQYLLLTTNYSREIKVHLSGEKEYRDSIKDHGNNSVKTYEDINPDNLKIVQFDIGQRDIIPLDRSVGEPNQFAVSFHGRDVSSDQSYQSFVFERQFADLFVDPPSDRLDTMDFDELKPKEGEVEILIVRYHDNGKGLKKGDLRNATIYILHPPIETLKTVPDAEPTYNRPKRVLFEMLDNLNRQIRSLDAYPTTLQDELDEVISKELNRHILFKRGKHLGYELSDDDKNILLLLYSLQVQFCARGSMLYKDEKDHFKNQLTQLLPFLNSPLPRRVRLAPKKYIGPEKWQKVLRKEQISSSLNLIPKSKKETESLQDELSDKEFVKLNEVEAFSYIGEYLNQTLGLYSGDIVENAGKEHLQKLHKRLLRIERYTELYANNKVSQTRASSESIKIDEWRWIKEENNRIFIFQESTLNKVLPTRASTYLDGADQSYNLWANIVFAFRRSRGDYDSEWYMNRLKYRVDNKLSNRIEASQMYNFIARSYREQFGIDIPDYLLKQVDAVAICQVIFQLRLLRYFDIRFNEISNYSPLSRSSMNEWIYWLNKHTSNINHQEKSIRRTHISVWHKFKE